MVFIESAFWGDEKSAKNITQVLTGRVVGNKITIDKVDDSLIPAFTPTPTGTLTKSDQQQIREKAEEACGGAADQNCVNLRIQQFTQEALQAKANDEITEASSEIIKGKRLTVNLRNDKGEMVRKVVAENGKFELEGVTGNPTDTLPSSEDVQRHFAQYTGITLTTFVWVFGVVATYTLFNSMGWTYAAPVLAFIALIIPNSGYFMIIFFFVGKSFVDTYVSL